MYPTRAELIVGSNVDELLNLSNEQQEALRVESIAAVERYTGQTFEAYEGIQTIDGTGGRELYLPRRLESIVGISVKGTDLELTEVVLSEKGDRLHIASTGLGYYEQALSAVQGRTWDSRTFRVGAGSIVIDGVWGWTVCPPIVEQAIRLEMEAQATADNNRLSGVVGGARRMGLTNVVQGNLRLSLGDPSEVTPRTARLLSSLVWHGAAGYLV